MNSVRFEWDEVKNKQNKQKHGASFNQAQYAFADQNRFIGEDVSHSYTEKWYYCFGKVGERVMTVRFTCLGKRIRIIGAGYWRKGRDIYEDAQK